MRIFINIGSTNYIFSKLVFQIFNMAIQPWRVGKVIKIENETSDTRRFWIEVPELTSFDFIPGQFVTLDLPIHEKPNKRWRSYSIASCPDDTNVFELVIVLDNNGLGTPYLFNQVVVGSEITLRGPQGVFMLKEPIDEDLVLICTGTGIAPFRSMIQNIKNSIVNLLREPANHINYAIDRYWFALQQRDNWYLLTPLTVVQRAGYSDIEKRTTDFVKAMTDLDKKELIAAYMKRLEESSKIL